MYPSQNHSTVIGKVSLLTFHYEDRHSHLLKLVTKIKEKDILNQPVLNDS